MMGTVSAKCLDSFKCLASFRHLANPSLAYSLNTESFKSNLWLKGMGAKEQISFSSAAFLSKSRCIEFIKSEEKTTLFFLFKCRSMWTYKASYDAL